MRIILISTHSQEFQGYFYNIVKSNLKNYIFYPFLDFNTLISLFCISSVGVVPSRYESFGQIIFDIMASGLPLLASSISPFTDFIQHGENGFLFNTEIDNSGTIIQINPDVDDLTRKMEEVLALKLSQKKNMLKKINATLHSYTIHSMADSYGKTYRRLKH